MVIVLKVKTLDSQTYEFSVDDEISVRQFKETIAEKTSISADLQRIIYCGRVLADEKQLKEYDVNGKVVHVVERAPPNLRSGNNSGGNGSRRENENNDPNVRASPLFRALDGMVVGAMTIPVNANGATTQPIAQSLNPSSSFCINRITVARHMLDCANNIASYLENPERGLNNTPLDILSQGRWTMESTVVEVGITAAGNVDIPLNQTQHFVEALNSAVSAALRQNGHQNFTVVQLPTMFRSNGSGGGSGAPSGAGANSQSPGGNQQSETRSETDEASSTPSAGPTNAAPEAAPSQPGPEERGRATPNNGASGSPTRQRTCTRVLAEVIHQMRTVQTRLEPFFQQYYDILLNDPTFEENDTAGRDNAQRIYDRVSEALHYMSHAQHAISDLMLDMSQSAPRHLCCRPILVEQSGYVSSNNYRASFLEPNGNNNETTMTNNNASTPSNVQQMEQTIHIGTMPGAPQQFTTPPQLQAAAANATTVQQSQSTATPTPTAPPAPITVAGETNQTTPQVTATTQSQTTATGQGQSQTQQRITIDTRDGLRRIISHFLQPMLARNDAPPTAPPTATATTTASTESGNQESQPAAEIVLNLAPRGILIPNPQFQVARLLQAVVNSAPIHADVHVQINAPNLLSYGMPVPPPTSQTPTQTQSTSQTNGVSTNNATEQNNGESNQPRVTTATHPTTSTQTRSTARPQVHIANLSPSQMWNTRVIPANIVSSFDRFLPCSSHHIRETEVNELPPHMMPNIYTRTRGHIRQVRRLAADESSTASTPRSTTTTNPPSSTRSSTSDDIFNLSNEDFNTPIQLFGSNLTLRDLINIAPSPVTLNRIRNELHTFIVNNLFAGAAITDSNMNDGINQVMQMLNSVLVFLPQFDLPDYDARSSVENFLRNTLPCIINLVREDDSNEFGTRLLRELMSFVRRMFVILVTCIGRSNAELYLNQVAQMTITSNYAFEQEALRALHRHLMSAVIRELDMTRQNTNEVQEFLVIRRPPPENNTTVTPMETDEVPAEQSPAVESNETVTHLRQDLESVLPVPAPVPGSNEPLPTVVAGSEPWHNNFPSHWLPIITRDMERQRRQSPQGPFSDAYISGMSAKRRKLVTNSKPAPDVHSLLSDGVRRALQTVGATSSGSTSAQSADEVSAAISSDPAAQTSYREALRSNIQERLKTDPDFTPDKFPNSSKYFNK